MPTQKREQKLITIKRIFNKEEENKFSLQDLEGEYYGGWKSYQDVMNTEYNQLLHGNHNEPFREGDQALIEFTKSVGANDKIYKNLKAIYPASTTPNRLETPIAQFGFSTPREKYEDSELHEINRKNRDSYFAANPPRNFEQEAYVKCCSIWAAAHIQAGERITGPQPPNGPEQLYIINRIQFGDFWELFQIIKKDGEKRFSPLRQAVENKKTGFTERVKDAYLETQGQEPDDEPPIEAFEDDPSF